MVDLTLSKKQQAIANAPWNQPALVLAPPGTGKTHTVIARLVNLITQQGLGTEELLILSFTRAAVREISVRIGELIDDESLHDDLRFTTLLTFDSFATRLMIAAEPDVDLSAAGYDTRIEMAIERLRDSTSSEARIAGKIRHVIVDEIQDLVGHRAELVRQLLQTISGGFTLLGDPAQAIYGWAIRDEEGGIDLDELLAWLRKQEWSPVLKESSLEVDYRSGGAIDSRTGQIRERILAAADDAEDIREDLEQIVEGLDSAGSPADPGDALQNPPEGSVCILCRTNGELLQVASYLSAEGTHYRLRPRSEDYALPAWIARVLGTIDQPRIQKRKFLDVWSRRIPEGFVPEPELAWKWLTRVTEEDRNSLNLERLRSELYRGRRLPDEADALLEETSDGVLLSTIHASKGREFDQVVILDPKRNSNPDQDDHLEEARVLYVAATRSKDKLMKLSRQGISFLMKWTCSDGRSRWISSARNGKYFIEVGLPGDFEACSPVSTYLFNNSADARAAQEYIWTSIIPGDPVLVQQVPRGRYRFYRIFHGHDNESDGQLVGQLGAQFAWDVKGTLKGLSKGRKFSYPFKMKTLRAAALTTEVLPAYPENTHEPYAKSRFCLGLRVKGMGYLWKR